MTNLDCKDIKALLSGLVDGELDAPTRHEVERHLADCKACRDMVSHAERLNEMVALDAQRNLWPVGLPAGFEEAVLRRTIYGEAYQFAGRRWTSWLGWVAAAACLLLALSAWVLQQQQRLTRGGPRGPVVSSVESHAGAMPAAYMRSWTSDRPQQADPSADEWDPALRRTVDEELALVQPILASRIESADAFIAPEDADTLYAASNLLVMLGQAREGGFADIERIRAIAEYDDLLERLASTRERLSPEDRATVMAAESILLRIVNGPLNLEDARLLQQTAQTLRLAVQLQAMSDRWPAMASSL